MLRSAACLAAAVVTLTIGTLAAQNTGISFQNGAVDTHVDVAAAPGLLPTRGITVEAWMTFDDATMQVGNGNRWPTICRHDVAPGGESYFLRVGSALTNNLNLEWACHNGSNLQFNVYQFVPGEFTNWTHVACTYDGQQSVIYINGRAVNTITVNGDLRDNGGLLRIGNGDVSTPGHEVWNGTIDEFRIWPFARTAAEIASTMNDELILVPGGITFNLNNSLRDTSSNFQGVATGTVPFVPGPTNLTSAAIGGFAAGNASTMCGDAIDVSVGARTSLGNPDFSFICFDGPSGASGVMFLSSGIAAAPFRLLGVDILLDLNGLLPIGVGTTTALNGTSRVALSLAVPGVVQGLAVSTQWVFLDPGCGPAGLTASRAISIGVQ